jgi:hypothetical protein
MIAWFFELHCLTLTAVLGMILILRIDITVMRVKTSSFRDLAGAFRHD